MWGGLLLLICIVFSTAASYSLKLGAIAEENQRTIIRSLINYPTLLGALFYAATFAAYAAALQKIPLSVAQPVVTAGASVLTALLSASLLRETIAPINWAGLLLIVSGIYLLFMGRG